MSNKLYNLNYNIIYEAYRVKNFEVSFKVCNCLHTKYVWAIIIMNVLAVAAVLHDSNVIYKRKYRR